MKSSLTLAAPINSALVWLCTGLLLYLCRSVCVVWLDIDSSALLPAVDFCFTCFNSASHVLWIASCAGSMVSLAVFCLFCVTLAAAIIVRDNECVEIKCKSPLMFVEQGE